MGSDGNQKNLVKPLKARLCGQHLYLLAVSPSYSRFIAVHLIMSFSQ